MLLYRLASRSHEWQDSRYGSEENPLLEKKKKVECIYSFPSKKDQTEGESRGKKRDATETVEKINCELQEERKEGREKRGIRGFPQVKEIVVSHCVEPPRYLMQTQL